MNEEKIKCGDPKCYHLFHKFYIAGAMPIYKCRCGAYYYQEDIEEAPRCKYTGRVFVANNPQCCWRHKWFSWIVKD